MKGRYVVPLSGGLDSALVAWTLQRHRRETVALLFVDYGQPYLAEEREAARYMARKLRLHLIEDSLPTMRARRGVFKDRNLKISDLGVLGYAALSASTLKVA